MIHPPLAPLKEDYEFHELHEFSLIQNGEALREFPVLSMWERRPRRDPFFYGSGIPGPIRSLLTDHFFFGY
jgi:hypothetical protein